MMKIVLQSFETGLYFDERGGWTLLPELAKAFSNTTQASEHKFRRRLEHTFVVVVPCASPRSDPTRKSAGRKMSLQA